MACKDMNRVVNDIPMYVRQWPASIALENLSEALGILGPKLSFFIDGTFSFDHKLQVLYSCDHKQLVALLKKFCTAVRIDGRQIAEIQFDQIFNGELHMVFDVFAFVCEVNYRDFFELGAPPPEPDQPEQEGPDKLESAMNQLTT